ncbi:MAG: hypothetical protein AVDCRST_MAG08-3411, partial [uncultured Acetobacteraceae bacterium]
DVPPRRRPPAPGDPAVRPPVPGGVQRAALGAGGGADGAALLGGAAALGAGRPLGADGGAWPQAGDARPAAGGRRAATRPGAAERL